MASKWKTDSVKKWCWKSALVDSTIDCLKEYKSLCEFNATDFKDNKVKLFTRLRTVPNNTEVFLRGL